MMKQIRAVVLSVVVMISLTACGGKPATASGSDLEQGIKAVEEAVRTERNEISVQNTDSSQERREGFTPETRIQDVLQDPAFEGFGRLVFPVDLELEETLTLKDMGNRLIWYSYVNPERTVSIVNEMKSRIQAGQQIFYDIYTDEEKAEDPSRKNTGLFYFRGNPGEKFAVVNAGGGFMYVAAMHDSFPHMHVWEPEMALLLIGLWSSGSGG